MPDANYDGSIVIDFDVVAYHASFTFTPTFTTNFASYPSDPGTFTVNLNATNDDPVGASTFATFDEDLGYANFTIADFGFSDPVEGHAFGGIIVTDLPDHGQLWVGSDQIIVSESIDAGDIGLLEYVQTDGDYNGTDSFDFAVFDTGTSDSGTSTSAYTFTLNISAVNDPPTGDNESVDATEDATYTFSAYDFSIDYSDTEGDAFAGIIITNAPAGLMYNGGSVPTTTIDVADIDLLTFAAGTDENNYSYTAPFASFNFMLVDAGTTSNTPSADNTSVAYTMDIDVLQVDDQEVVTNFTVTGDFIEDKSATMRLSVTDTIDGGIDGDVTIYWLLDGSPAFTDVLTGSGDYTSTYTFEQGDGGKQLTAMFSFLDMDGNVNTGTADFEDMYTLYPGVLVGHHEVGSAANDSLTGGITNDWLEGHAGHDTLNGGEGNDSMVGGTGNDTYLVDNTADIVAESGLYDLKDVVLSWVSYALTDDLDSGKMAGLIENLTLQEDPDALTGEGNSKANILTGNSYNNTFWGEDGNDTIDGGAGEDSMYGGMGNDTYIVDNYYDWISEDASGGTNDKVNASTSYALSDYIETLTLTGTGNIDGTGNAQANTINGNNGANTLWGEGGNDTMYGLNGDDMLIGGAGNDSMSGGSGNDTYNVDSLADKVLEGSTGGTGDTVNVYVSGYTMANYVEVGNLVTGSVLNGNAQSNTINGNTSSNTLKGAGGNDSISGDAGNDQITGGAGRDTLTGGADNDTFIYTLVTESSTAAAGDTITDFTPLEDKISLTAIDANVSLSGNQNFTYINSDAFNAVGSTSGMAEVRYDPTTGYLEASNDSDAAAELVVFIGMDLNVADVGASLML
ncbi:MAG: hypothetical protein HY854_18710 [Burkholderiales bacterium]|nr:hypothetical protein [Burkholderiales bacterium]